jgi:hypothetical protein
MAIKTASRIDYDIDALIEDIRQPDVKVVLFFFSIGDEKNEPQKALKKAFPAAVVAGMSMIGGYSTSQVVKNGIMAMSLSGEEVETVYSTMQTGVKEAPERAAQSAITELKQKIRDELNPVEYLGLVFSDGLARAEPIMEELTMEKSLNAAFVGGTAADEATFTQTDVVLDGRI